MTTMTNTDFNAAVDALMTEMKANANKAVVLVKIAMNEFIAVGSDGKPSLNKTKLTKFYTAYRELGNTGRVYALRAWMKAVVPAIVTKDEDASLLINTKGRGAKDDQGELIINKDIAALSFFEYTPDEKPKPEFDLAALIKALQGAAKRIEKSDNLAVKEEAGNIASMVSRLTLTVNAMKAGTSSDGEPTVAERLDGAATPATPAKAA